ncbi:MAG: hypothetical protein AB1726_03215 [Planctomycetota bacterium]
MKLTMNLDRVLLGLGTILVLCALPALCRAAAAPARLASCYGEIVGEDLICQGDPCCHEEDRTDGIGRYWYCTCSSGGAEPYCCHTVLRAPDADHKEYWGDGRGMCTPAFLCGGGVCDFVPSAGQAGCMQ